MAESQPKKTPSRREVDAYAAAKANKALKGIGEIPRRRQGAVNAFSESLREGRAACPPYTPVLTPNLADALWASLRKLNATGDAVTS